MALTDQAHEFQNIEFLFLFFFFLISFPLNNQLYPWTIK